MRFFMCCWFRAPNSFYIVLVVMGTSDGRIKIERGNNTKKIESCHYNGKRRTKKRNKGEKI